jgi:hypothetical protein
MKKTTKNNLALKIISVLFFSLLLFFSPFPQRKASAWLDTLIPKFLLPPMDQLLQQLNVMMTGASKQAAIKMITQNVYNSVSGGGGGGPKFIVDWQMTLETDPQKQAAIYIESMSSMSTQMRGSVNYQSSEGVGGNYMSGLSNIVGGITSQVSSSNKCPLTYTGNPANMFADGTFKNFSKFMSGVNNPWSYQSCMQNAYLEKLASLQKIAEIKAVANQGFIGSPGYPGILIKEKMANVENMGNQVIANANGIAEVITSAVMKMTMDAMNNGIGNVQAQIQKGAGNPLDKLNTQTQNQSNNFGPGAMFGNSSMPTPPELPGLPTPGGLPGLP